MLGTRPLGSAPLGYFKTSGVVAPGGPVSISTAAVTEFAGTVAVKRQAVFRATGGAEFRGTAAVKPWAAVRPSAKAEFVGTSSPRKQSNARVTGATEFAGTARLVAQANARTSAVTEFRGNANATERYALRTRGASEYRGQSGTAGASTGTIATKGVSGLTTPPVALKVLIGVRVAALSEFKASTIVRPQTAFRVSTGTSGLVGSARLVRWQTIRATAGAEFKATTGKLGLRYVMRTRGESGLVARSTLPTPVVAENIYGNPGAPYGYGPYGWPNPAPISVNAASEYLTSILMYALVGFQPALYYGRLGNDGRTRMDIWVGVGARRAVFEFAGRGKLGVWTVLHDHRARFEFRARSTHTAIFGARVTARFELVTRAQITYAWSDLTNPSRVVDPGWIVAAAAPDPWHDAGAAVDPWRTARPALEP